MRLDLLLVVRKLARSRSHAAALIREGLVIIESTEPRKLKPSLEVPEEVEIQLLPSDLNHYVSRSALKLKQGLLLSEVSLKGMTVLDIGQSTGGFTQVCLEYGAAKVIGIEVGHSQLDASLRQDPRVICIEGANARKLSSYIEYGSFDFFVIDVSFISVTLLLSSLATLCRLGISGIILVKPQFELGKAALNKAGVVVDADSFFELQTKMIQELKDNGFKTKYYEPCHLRGTDGNQEFIVGVSFSSVPDGLSDSV